MTMSTGAIINNIQTLPITEQFFIVEQVLKSIHDTEQKQVELAEKGSVKTITASAVPKGYMTSEEFRRRATVKVNQFCDRHGVL